MKHEFRVHWETRTRFSVRNYARYFDTEAEAVAFAREKRRDPLIEAIDVWEQESGDVDGMLHVTLLGRVKWWKD